MSSSPSPATIRQTTSHALKALTDYPEQRAWLLENFDDRIGSAVEEFVRWATPVMTFRRTAAVDYELNGQQILAGEKVVMFYSSGNRDERAFDEPNRFDLSRERNPHVGFGGTFAWVPLLPAPSCVRSSLNCSIRSPTSPRVNRVMSQAISCMRSALCHAPSEGISEVAK